MQQFHEQQKNSPPQWTESLNQIVRRLTLRELSVKRLSIIKETLRICFLISNDCFRISSDEKG